MCTHLLQKHPEKEKPAIVSARTMDFGTVLKPFPVTLKPNVVVYPRNTSFPLKFSFMEKLEERFRLLPKKPLKWTNPFGFIAVDVGPNIFNTFPFKVEDLSPVFLDGMNEKGLSAASLWLSGSQYQPESDQDNNLLFLDVVGYVLGNCASVAAVKDQLSRMQVVCPSDFLRDYPAHFIFSDADPNSTALVVEYIKGSPHFYKVPNGVLTNQPAYPEMLKRLAKYKDLTVYQKNKSALPGLLGLPADASPTSRFVRATKFVESIHNPSNVQEAVNWCDTLIQNIQVPLGSVVNATNGQMEDYTQWTVLRDHVNLTYYYKTFDSQSLKKVDLSTINFSTTDTISVPMSDGAWAIDLTKRYSGG